MLRVLLTNDDGIGAAGLQTLRRALLEVDDVELVTIAPDSNRSATARSITFSRPLWVTDVDFEDGTRGYACDGTPVDCVRLAERLEVEPAATFTARVVDRLEDVPLPEGTLLNINVPAGDPDGVEVTRLGKRIYRDELKVVEREDGRRRYHIYGDSPVHDDEQGTDLAAVSAGRVAVTPLHFDLTAAHGLDALRDYDLTALLA